MKPTAAMKISRLKSEIKKINKYIVPLEEAGIEADYVTGMLISAKAQTKEDIRKIVSIYNPSELAKLTFAGKDYQQTESPFLLDVGNWSAEHFPTIKVRYESGDVKVWITVPADFFTLGRTEETKRVVRDGNSTTAVIGHNYYAAVTDTVQRYSGGGDVFGSRVTYAADEKGAQAIYDALGLDGYKFSESHTN